MIRKIISRLFSILVFCLWVFLGFQGINKAQPLFGIAHLGYNPLDLFSQRYMYGNIAYMILLLLAVLLWMVPKTNRKKK